MEKVTREVAEKEVESWLDKKKILKGTREQNKDMIETLVGAIEEGVLVLNEDFTMDHNLMFPLQNDKGEVTLNKLVYVPRLNDKMLRPYMQGIKQGDSLAYLNAYVCALSKTASEVISNLDSVDKKISMAVATFFL